MASRRSERARSLVDGEDINDKRWRRVAGTPDGRKMIARLLDDLYTFQVVPEDDIGRVALQNYGKTVLEYLGVTMDRTERVLGKLLEIPPRWAVDGDREPPGQGEKPIRGGRA